MNTFPYWRLSSFYLCYFSLLGATAPFLALYFDYLGFPPARIGELVAIPMLMRCIAPNLWGWLGDRTGERLRIVRFGAICTFLSLALLFVDQSYAWLALVMALHAFFWHAVLPQFEVITLAHLKERTANYSRVRVWGSVGFVLAVVGLGKAFELAGMGIYPWTLLIIVAGIVVSSFWVPSASPVVREQRIDVEGFFGQLRRPAVLCFFASVALMQLSHGPYYTFLSIHLQTLGYTRSVIGLLWALGVLSEIVLFLFMASIISRFDVRQVLVASFLLAALRWLLLGILADHLAVLLLAQLFHAATFGAFHAAAVHFVQGAFGHREQGQGQALYAALAGTGGALGALYSGYTWSTLGAGWTFAIASLAALGAAGIICVPSTRRNPI
ncbi:MFS transporter [Pseudomonas matsuisoli]|uniref:MFS metabolite transporter n=1 Tax=Pseudomonas matsuisoli TaxID=1515666 RepID=A0A917PSM0_9PSED|nr:MFS transporter [Pseudomonas matsuisoli]GGJ90190.1 MFS metabolite transporter [Pseudomonas matsuisoli]